MSPHIKVTLGPGRLSLAYRSSRVVTGRISRVRAVTLIRPEAAVLVRLVRSFLRGYRCLSRPTSRTHSGIGVTPHPGTGAINLCSCQR
jgi:hypothetical protein